MGRFPTMFPTRKHYKTNYIDFLLYDKFFKPINCCRTKRFSDFSVLQSINMFKKIYHTTNIIDQM